MNIFSTLRRNNSDKIQWNREHQNCRVIADLSMAGNDCTEPSGKALHQSQYPEGHCCSCLNHVRPQEKKSDPWFLGLTLNSCLAMWLLHHPWFDFIIYLQVLIETFIDTTWSFNELQFLFHTCNRYSEIQLKWVASIHILKAPPWVDLKRTDR